MKKNLGLGTPNQNFFANLLPSSFFMEHTIVMGYRLFHALEPVQEHAANFFFYFPFNHSYGEYLHPCFLECCYSSSDHEPEDCSQNGWKDFGVCILILIDMYVLKLIFTHRLYKVKIGFISRSSKPIYCYNLRNNVID